jgi:Na+/H+ antiporter NhaC
MLIILMALLIALKVLPDFGPMRKAEQRVAQTGALFREGANPLVDESVDSLDALAADDRAPSLLLELALPVAVVITVFAWSLIALGSVKIVEAFMAGSTVLIAVLLFRRRLTNAADVAGLISRGAESVMPALIIVALAYALNEVARQLGVGDAIVALFSSGLSIDWLVPLTFLVTAAIAFSTGTSWGSFALMMPVALPVAFSFSDGEVSVLVYQTVAAIAGGGIFGDHSSPVSDTTVLASLGAGSDHMDHVITQLPYALVTAGLTLLIYVLI